MNDAATHSREERALPRGWRWAALGEVAQLNPRRPPLDRHDDALTTFVPMESVDAETGTITTPLERTYAEVRRGYTYFEEDDVLFSKITPCMQNGKHAIASGLINGLGFGTTEFHVLRPGADILATWIHRYLRQQEILRRAAGAFTGAVGQQRVPGEWLGKLNIPLPPLDEQRRIARALDDQMAAVARARAAAQSQLRNLEALPPALLRAAFSGAL